MRSLSALKKASSEDDKRAVYWSGTGKSTSLRNFDPAEIGIFNVASKPLPFRKQLMAVNGARYGDILTRAKEGQRLTPRRKAGMNHVNWDEIQEQQPALTSGPAWM